MNFAFILTKPGTFNADTFTVTVEAYGYDLDLPPCPYVTGADGQPLLQDGQLVPLTPLPLSPIPPLSGTYAATDSPATMAADLLQQTAAGYAALAEAQLRLVEQQYTDKFITAALLDRIPTAAFVAPAQSPVPQGDPTPVPTPAPGPAPTPPLPSPADGPRASSRPAKKV